MKKMTDVKIDSFFLSVPKSFDSDKNNFFGNFFDSFLLFAKKVSLTKSVTKFLQIVFEAKIFSLCAKIGKTELRMR